MESLTFWLCSCFIIWLFSLSFLSKLVGTRKNKVKFPPGPKPWPIIGNLNVLGTIPHRSLHKLSQKYGGIMQLKFGSSPVIVVSTPKMAKEFLKTHDQIFLSRPVTAAGRHMSYKFSDLSWAPYGPYWCQARKIYTNELLSTKKLDFYGYIRIEQKKYFISELYSCVGKPIVLKRHLLSYTMTILSRMALGDKYFHVYKTEDSSVTNMEELQETLEEWFALSGAFNIGDWIPWLSFLDLQGYVKRMKAVYHKMNKFNTYVFNDHRAKKKLAGKNFKPKDFIDVLLQVADDPSLDFKLTNDNIKALVQSVLVGGFDTTAIMQWAISELLIRMALGDKYFHVYKTEDSSVTNMEELQETLEEWFALSGAFNIGDWIPWLSFLDLQGYVKRMKAVYHKMNKFNTYVFNDHRAKKKLAGKNFKPKDFIDVLLQVADDPSLDFKLTNDNIKALVQSVLVGGFDTTAITVEWAISELLIHPDILEKVTEEIDRVIGRERWIEEKDSAQLPFLDAIVKETMRFHPAATLNAPHSSIEDCNVSGYHIPKGTTLLVNTWSLGRDPRYWDNPEEFRPERFLGKDIDEKGQKFELLPFGSGRRMCPGYRLGMVLVRSTLGSIIQGFNWKLADSMKPDDIDMEEEYGMTTHRKNPIVVILEPRLQAHMYRLGTGKPSL